MTARSAAGRPGALPRRPDPRLRAFLEEGVSSRRVNAAVALVGDRRSIRRWAAAGESSQGRAVEPRDLYDLASITKPIVAGLALRLDAAGRLALELPVGEVWPRARPELARRPLSTLLRHRSGLVAWTPLYRRCRRRESAARLLTETPALLGAPTGTYSDLGFALWGLSAERRLETPLERLLERHLLRAHGEREIVARPGRRRPVDCRLGNEREIALAAAQGIRIARLPAPPAGQPQDGNARFLGGAAGHAGLFGSAPALWRFAREWLAPGTLFDPAAVAAALAGGDRFALGWARRRVWSSAGAALPESAFGHSGFTGGSLWVDPERGRIYVLLAHRLAVARPLEAWHRSFHRLAAGSARRR